MSLVCKPRGYNPLTPHSPFPNLPNPCPDQKLPLLGAPPPHPGSLTRVYPLPFFFTKLPLLCSWPPDSRSHSHETPNTQQPPGNLSWMSLMSSKAPSPNLNLFSPPHKEAQPPTRSLVSLSTNCPSYFPLPHLPHPMSEPPSMHLTTVLHGISVREDFLEEAMLSWVLKNMQRFSRQTGRKVQAEGSACVEARRERMFVCSMAQLQGV